MSNLQIDDLTLRDLRTIRDLFNKELGAPKQETIPAHPYPTGENVFVRTVTMHFTGRLTRVTAGELVLCEAAWIADSGRFHVALASGTLNEVEPYPDTSEVIIPRGSIIDVSRWLHPLPRSAK